LRHRFDDFFGFDLESEAVASRHFGDHVEAMFRPFGQQSGRRRRRNRQRNFLEMLELDVE
jgi:hypothetical protein